MFYCRIRLYRYDIQYNTIEYNILTFNIVKHKHTCIINVEIMCRHCHEMLNTASNNFDDTLYIQLS